MSGPMLVSYVVLWVLVGLLCVAVWAMYHHFGQVYLNSREGRSRQGPEEGKQLPASVEADVAGMPIALPAAGAPTLLLFAGTQCSLCHEVGLELPAFVRDHALKPVIVCTGKREKVQGWADELAGSAVVIPDPGGRISNRYSVGVIPFGVVADVDGVVVLRGLVNGREGLEWMAEAASKGSRADVAPEVEEEVGAA